MEIFAAIAQALADQHMVFGLFLVLGMLLQIAMLINATRNSKDFRLVEVITGPNGHISATKVIQMVCLEVAIWAFVLYGMETKLDQLGIWWVLLLLIGIGSPVVNKLADVVVSRYAGVPVTPDPPETKTTTKVGPTGATETVTEVKPAS